MMVLVIGGSGSGKSAFAEGYTQSLSESMTKYYIATMKVFDNEGQKKVLRHQMLRSGKGFLTIEQQTDLEQAIQKMKEEKRVVLLECMSNLVANEMFSEIEPVQEEIVTERIVKAVRLLNANTEHLIIVSNNVFEDGKIYDDTTMSYIRAMGKINEKMAEIADEAVEVVVGIPLFLKKAEREEKEKRCAF